MFNFKVFSTNNWFSRLFFKKYREEYKQQKLQKEKEEQIENNLPSSAQSEVSALILPGVSLRLEETIEAMSNKDPKEEIPEELPFRATLQEPIVEDNTELKTLLQLKYDILAMKKKSKSPKRKQAIIDYINLSDKSIKELAKDLNLSLSGVRYYKKLANK